MVTDIDPVVGSWYRHLDKGQRFEVVAVDEAGGTVEVQHYDGDVEEMELDSWYDQQLEMIEPPENWTGPFDDIEPDDLDYSETDMAEEDWEGPLNEHNEGEGPSSAGGRHAGEEEE